MRANKKYREGLRGGVYTYFLIEGLNLDNFVSTLVKKGISLYGVKKYTRKRLKVGVNKKEEQKFFAITSNLCYNVKKIGEGGKFFPLVLLKRNIAGLIGAIIFCCLAFLGGDLVLDIDYHGNGEVYQEQVQTYLESEGIKKFTRFSSFSLSQLEDEILAVSPNFSFVSCVKNGNRLSVELVLKNSPPSTLKEQKFQLVSKTDGVVKSLTVYRGTQVVSVGDCVKAGQVLVEGYAVVRDKIVPVNVLAVAEILKTDIFEYRSQNAGEEDLAEVFALESLQKPLVHSVNVSVKEENNEFRYIVEVISVEFYSTYL